MQKGEWLLCLWRCKWTNSADDDDDAGEFYVTRTLFTHSFNHRNCCRPICEGRLNLSISCLYCHCRCSPWGGFSVPSPSHFPFPLTCSVQHTLPICHSPTSGWFMNTWAVNYSVLEKVNWGELILSKELIGINIFQLRLWRWGVVSWYQESFPCSLSSLVK